MINFIKRYPNFSKTREVLDRTTEGRYDTPLIPLFLSELPKNSTVVYASPERGDRLKQIKTFLSGHRLIMIENFVFFQKEEAEHHKKILKKNIESLPSNIDVQLIEEDFNEVWRGLQEVDMLILDGPPTTYNFEPFSKKFIYILHDFYQRLTHHLGLAEYFPLICREDENLLVDSYFREHPDIHEYFFDFSLLLEMPDSYRKYGPFAWLAGEKL